MNPPKTALFISQLCILSSVSHSLLLRGGDGGDQQQQQSDVRTATSRIIGGTESIEGQFSYTVSLQDEFGHFCGGSLIAKDVVLSASHCQHSEPGYKAVIGRRDLEEVTDGEEITVKKEITHPEYNWGTTDHDFMVLILERPTTEDVDLVKPGREIVPVGSAVSVLGWGDTAASDDELLMSYDLRTTEVFVISNEVCEQSSGDIGGMQDNYHDQITENMVCAKDVGEDSCQGDSGGPLVLRQSSGQDVQVGIVSWGVGCADADFPGVYARVSAGYDWIREQVCKESSDPPASFECQKVATAKPSSPSSQQTVVVGNENEGGSWTTIVREDFTNGFGMFTNHGNNALHYISAKGRDGVVRLDEQQGFMSFRTKQFPLEDTYSKIRISFSFFAITPKLLNNICLDTWTDEGYNGKNCWNATQGLFDENRWYDDNSFELDASNARTLRMRFRIDGGDDVLLDSVTVQGRI